MKGIEHFRKAEQLLGLVEEREDGFSDTYLKAALVHATLAAATSMSNLVTVWGDIAAMMRADAEVLAAVPTRAEPLLKCNAAPADDGPERCGLAVDHDGLHEYDAGGGRIVSWSSPAELHTIAPHSIYESTATDLHMEMPR